MRRAQALQNPSFKYIDLAQKLMRQIAVGGLQPGDRLPTEDELVEQHQLSRITVRRALSMLEADGLISRRRKAGTFVNRAIDQSTDLQMIRGTVVVVLSPTLETGVDETNVGENHALATTIRALEQYLSERGFSVQIMSVGRDEMQDRARLLHLIDKGELEAVCVHGSGGARYHDLLAAVPTVTACTVVPQNLPWVGESIDAAIYPLIRLLLDKGHERIALLCGPWDDSRAFAGFAQAYRRAFEERGVPFDRSLLYHAYAGESLSELAVQILSADNRPTAICAEDWRVAKAVLSAAQQLKLKIPGDLSLVASGENLRYLDSPVRITCHLSDNWNVGLEIGRVLVDLIDGRPAPTEPVFVPGKLIEHDSVAPPNGSTGVNAE